MTLHPRHWQSTARGRRKAAGLKLDGGRLAPALPLSLRQPTRTPASRPVPCAAWLRHDACSNTASARENTKPRATRKGAGCSTRRTTPTQTHGQRLGANSPEANSPGDGPRPSEIAILQVRAAYIDINRRLLASLVGLPRVCAVKKCRRRKRCFGAGQPCLAHHRGLIAARFEAALQRTGWDVSSK